MSTYFVVNASITDRQLLDAYRAAVGASMEGHDVSVLVSTNDAEIIEGEPAGQRVVLLRFADKDAFHAWYDSPAYQSVIGMRTGSTEGFAVLVDGRD